MIATFPLLDVSPWLIGWGIGGTLGRFVDERASFHLVMAGACSFLSFYVWSLVIWVAVEACRFDVLTVSIFLFFLVGALLVNELVHLRKYRRLGAGYGVPMIAALAITIVVYFSLSFYVSTLSPISSWDFLGEWPERGYAAYALEMAGRLHGECSGTYIYEHRHPRTIATMSAWSAITQSGYGGLLWWPLGALSTVAVVVGASTYTTDAPVFGFFGALLLLTLPLYENQMVLGGYAESLLANAVVISTALLVAALRRNNWAATIMCVAVGAMPIFTKSSGLLYTLPILLALVFSKLPLVIYRKYFPLALGFALVIFSATVIFGFDFSFGEVLVSWSPSTGTITFAGRSEVLNFESAGQIVTNLSRAYFANSSFSLAFCALLITSLVCVGPLLSRQERQIVAPTFAFFLVFIILLTFLLATQLTDYGQAIAGPQSDTGNSRFTLPLMALVSLVPCVAALSLRPKQIG
jgi:hypothetical protein